MNKIELIGDYEWTEFRNFMINELIQAETKEQLIEFIKSLFLSIGTPEQLKERRKKMGLPEFTKEEKKKMGI